jgi:hypothetical protein
MQVSTHAGGAGEEGYDDGAAATARFSYPSGLDIDSAGRVFVTM